MFKFFRKFRDCRDNYILIIQLGDNFIPFVCKSFEEAKKVYNNIGVDVDNYVIYQASPVEIMKGGKDGE